MRFKLLVYKHKYSLVSFVEHRQAVQKSSEHINEKLDGPYHGFSYLSLFSDPTDLTKWSQCNTVILQLSGNSSRYDAT